MRIGIITMHRVLNFGSALQSYALQKKIMELGYECEIIDYCYPADLNETSLQRLLRQTKDFAVGSPRRKKKNRFLFFQKEFILLSSDQYNKESLNDNPPEYDLYLVGSDQVWNPKFCRDNPGFLLNFVPDNKPKMAFASSFAVDSIPKDLQPFYIKYLSRFDEIAVRESYGCTIVKQLTGKTSTHVCDPVILLEKTQWLDIAQRARIREKKPYILVYIPAYMFNPYPGVDFIVEEIREKLGYRVIYLEGTRRDLFKPNSKLHKNGGPIEFVNLFAHASFVVTTSFHGAAFASIFGIPFLGVVKDKSSEGDRICSLLRTLDCEKSLVDYNRQFILEKDSLGDYICKKDKLDFYRIVSVKQLLKMLSDIGM